MCNHSKIFQNEKNRRLKIKISSKFQKNFYDQGTKTIKLFQMIIIGTVCLTLSHL